MTASELGPLLEAAYRANDTAAGIARDPVRFPRRYTESADCEVAAVFASQLAYGRVELFGAVLERLFGLLDARGGPRAFVDGFDERAAADLEPLLYRWNRGVDWILMSAGLQRLTRAHGSLERAFAGENARASLSLGLTALTAEIEAVAPDWGVVGPLPRGVRNWLSHPSRGSACKRWNLFLRWMVRPPTEGVDLGIWSMSPAGLVVPVDTHVHRVAGFLGLTDRSAADWKTAEQITRALARIDPDDPVRFDFALAHLGISGACLGRADRAVCPSCPLSSGCTIWLAATR